MWLILECDCVHTRVLSVLLSVDAFGFLVFFAGICPHCLSHFVADDVSLCTPAASSWAQHYIDIIHQVPLQEEGSVQLK